MASQPDAVPLGSSIYNKMRQAQAAAQAAANKASAGLKSKKQVIVDDSDDEGIGDDAQDYANFANVSTSDLERYGLAPHPSPVCEAATLSSVPSPEVKYSVKIPANVLQSGAISALQFHAVRLACARHEHKLPDGTRAGFFLGDGPGVGKGRQIAAIAFNYFCRGKTKVGVVQAYCCAAQLVALSKPDRPLDLEALGMLDYDAVRLHDLRSLKIKAGKSLSSLKGLESGILFCTYDLLTSGTSRGKKKTASGATQGRKGAGKNAAAARLSASENLQPWQLQQQQQKEPSPDAEEQQEFWAEEHDEEAAAEEFGPGSRLNQICEWLGGEDYLIVLDECHRQVAGDTSHVMAMGAKNCLPKDFDKEPGFPIDLLGSEGAAGEAAAGGKAGWGKKSNNSSKTARAVIELQRRCPNARVLYVSATGASEAENLCYMERLGLWGPGSAFPTKPEFVKLLKAGGIGAMEMVAMELKGAGCYLSRSLSWMDVRFDTVAIEASPSFVAMYDAAVEVWSDTRDLIIQTNLHKARRSVMAQFYSAQLRFFRQLCTAAKVDTVISLCEAALAAGQSPVVGLQSTGEARTAEYVATKAAAAAKDGDDPAFDSFVEPAALILSSFIQNNMMECPEIGHFVVALKQEATCKDSQAEVLANL
eukprot:gene14309-36_t